MKIHWNHMAGMVLLAGTVSLQAQLISVKSGLSADSMMIGDQVLFTIHVEAAGKLPFQMPVIRDTLCREIEVLFKYASDTSHVDDRIVVDHSYIITSFEAGVQMIPSQQVIYEFNNSLDTALSMPLILRVHEPAVDTTQQIKAIKPPVNTPVSLKEVLPWLALGSGVWLVGTLVMALIWMYRQRRKDPEIFSLRPQEPAHIVAFRSLDKLREEKLWESGRVKLYYTRLTEITRQYIERQYGIPAMERTTEEILEAFRKSNTEDPLLDEMLKDLLELADLVKFAKEDPLPLENQTNMNNAYLFVQKTYPLFFVERSEEKEKAEAKKEPDGKEENNE
ncbi:MAG: hypothetical protein V2B15_00465 [Bacteroidota bacterium]